MYQEFCRFKQHVEFVFTGPLLSAKDNDRAGWLGVWVDNKTQQNSRQEYVRPRQVKRAARFKVKQRKQAESELFDNFVKDLRLIIMDCEYTDPDDVLIDVIIAGGTRKAFGPRQRLYTLQSSQHQTPV